METRQMTYKIGMDYANLSAH